MSFALARVHLTKDLAISNNSIRMSPRRASRTPSPVVAGEAGWSGRAAASGGTAPEGLESHEAGMSDRSSSTSCPAEKVKQFPTTAGLYLMKDAQGRVIYIGKAKNLRSRASAPNSGKCVEARIREQRHARHQSPWYLPLRGQRQLRRAKTSCSRRSPTLWLRRFRLLVPDFNNSG